MKMSLISASAVLALVLQAPGAQSDPGRVAFNFQAPSIGGPNGEISMNGGGSYDLASLTVSGGGTFRCLNDIKSGPLTGLKAGEGVRWQAAQLLPSSGFKCSADPTEVGKTVVTDNDTVVLLVDFFRAGDGSETPLHAKLFVSAQDEGTDLPGIQNVWIQVVGCGEASTNVR